MACATLTLKRSLEFDSVLTPRTPKRRCTMVAVSPPNTPSTAHTYAELTAFANAEKMASDVSAELKKLQHFKLLDSTSLVSGLASSPQYTSYGPGVLSLLQASPSMQASHASTTNSPEPAGVSYQPQQRKEAPLFTFRQVNSICERMVREHEKELREQYDKVLAGKLSEQYESYLKFNHNLIQRRFRDCVDATYVS